MSNFYVEDALLNSYNTMPLTKEQWCSMTYLEIWDVDTIPNEIGYLTGLEGLEIYIDIA